ncbi:MAG: flagellar hook capping FlgD N-terminal domain-containing protein [Paracoccaceae bacterium]
MEISPTTSQTTTTQTTKAARKTESTGITSDYNTFLKMLTTQMQNQDPTNPIDSADYAVQLATFSGVEQQTQTNQLLAQMNTQFGMLGMAQLAGWVGQEARAAVPVYLDGAAITLSPNPAAVADRAVLVVKDSAGKLVSREDLPLSDAPYEWLGADAKGEPLPRGLYTLTLESYSGEELLGATAVESYARILEAQSGASGTTLLLAGGVKVPAAEVTALRVP